MNNFLIFKLAGLIISVLEVIDYLLIAYIILGWLVVFGVLKNPNSFLLKVYMILFSKIEPVLMKIRRFVPSLMGLDFSVLVLFFIIYLLKVCVVRLAWMVAF